METIKMFRGGCSMRNLTLLTDLYQLTMMYGYFKNGMTENEGVFDLFSAAQRYHLYRHCGPGKRHPIHQSPLLF